MDISFSKYSKFNECSAKYKFYYIDKIKPEDNEFSSLIFGRGIDLTLNDMLISINTNFDYVEHFKRFWKEVDYSKITFYKSDFDSRWFEKSEEDIVNFVFTKGSSPTKDQILEAKRIVSESLLKKGLVILKTYNDLILPQIDTVECVQKNVDISNCFGDNIKGVIDVILKFKDDENMYIVDNKTTSKAYSDDSVSKSFQLATYAGSEGNNNGCFIALEKKLPKKGDYAKFKIIKGVIEDEFIKNVFSSYQETLDKIKNEDFEKNFNSGCFFYGRKCEYYSYCRTGSLKGLKKEITNDNN